MNQKDMILNRHDANMEIARLLEGTEFDKQYKISEKLIQYSKAHTQLRCGQIITNWITTDYREETVSDYSKAILEFLFPGDPDPFFEESYLTLCRLKKRILK